MNEIKDRVCKVLERLDREDFNFQLSFAENGLDSLDVIEIAYEVEKEFNIHFDDFHIEHLNSYEELEKRIIEQLNMKRL